MLCEEAFELGGGRVLECAQRINLVGETRRLCNAREVLCDVLAHEQRWALRDPRLELVQGRVAALARQVAHPVVAERHQQLVAAVLVTP